MDVYEPWQMFLVAAGAPFLSYAVYEFLGRKRHGRPQAAPGVRHGGIYGLIMVGLIDWGTAKGGYFGITEGDYAFQHAEISLWWQLIGIAVCFGVGMITAAVLGFIFNKTFGMRIDDDVQAEGLDNVLWELPDEYELHGNGAGRPRPRKDAGLAAEAARGSRGAGLGRAPPLTSGSAPRRRPSA